LHGREIDWTKIENGGKCRGRNTDEADFANWRGFIFWWNWVLNFSQKQIRENQRNLLYQCSYRQRKWNTEEADFAVPLQLTPSLEQYVCKRNTRIYFLVELGIELFAETDP
jgi:hypothetical protein